MADFWFYDGKIQTFLKRLFALRNNKNKIKENQRSEVQFFMKFSVI